VKRAGLEATTSELRTRAVELGRETMREIEIAADSIDAGTADPRILRNTLFLRLSSVPAVTEAVLREDPVVAMLDLYGFNAQLKDFLASPAGSAALGDGAAIARRAVGRLAERWEVVATSAGADVKDENRDKLASWARAHPIDRLPFTRASVIGDLGQILRNQQSGIGAAVGGMQASLDRLEFRVSLANESAVKQAVWLARLAALDASGSPEAAELKGTLTSTRSLIESAPDLVDRERLALAADVDRQRRETLVDLAEERTILLGAVLSERTAILLAVTEQRLQVMKEADSLRVRLVADEIRVVDHLMWRITELLGALLVVVAIGLPLLLRRRP
jgi:hypothetical protein